MQEFHYAYMVREGERRAFFHTRDEAEAHLSERIRLGYKAHLFVRGWIYQVEEA